MKKKLAVLLAAAMMMGAMTGCGSSAKTETTEAETKAEETTEAAENEDNFQSSILFCGSTSCTRSCLLWHVPLRRSM